MSQTNAHVLCPYCGHVQKVSPQCVECGGHFEPLSVKATQISMGPWFIRDRNRPYQPGCSFQVLQRLLAAGKIRPNTILRGPTTHQLWEVARNVPGVAHLLGFCHKCNTHVTPQDRQCPKCQAIFATPTQRDELGLYYRTDAEATAALEKLQDEISGQSAAPKPVSPQPQTAAPLPHPLPQNKPEKSKSSSSSSSHKLRPGEDILAQIIGPIQSSETSNESPKNKPLTAREQSTPTHKHGAEMLLPPTDIRTTPTATNNDAEPVDAVGLSDRSEFYADQSDATSPAAKKSQWSLTMILLVTGNGLLLIGLIYWIIISLHAKP